MARTSSTPTTTDASANNYGLELDIRKQLDFIGLKDFSAAFYGALIHSRVRFAPGSNEYDCPMQGESPYLVNTGIFYYNEPLQLSGWTCYNRIGKRIVGVGRTTGGGDASRNIRVPDSYEMPRDAFDLTASKRFGPLEIKLAIRDLLNQQVTFKQFSDVMVQGEGRRIEQVTRRYRPGMNHPLGHSHTLISPRRCVGAKGHCISKKNNVKSTSGVGASPLIQHNN